MFAYVTYFVLKSELFRRSRSNVLLTIIYSSLFNADGGPVRRNELGIRRTKPQNRPMHHPKNSSSLSGAFLLPI